MPPGDLARSAATAVLTVVALLAASASGLALFSDTAAVGDNTLATDVLDPPANTTATAGCTLDLVPEPKVEVTWEAPATPVDAYRVYRSTTAGGPYDLLDSLDADLLDDLLYVDLEVSVDVTYYYVVDDTYESWSSASSNEDSATVLSC